MKSRPRPGRSGARSKQEGSMAQEFQKPLGSGARGPSIPAPGRMPCKGATMENVLSQVLVARDGRLHWRDAAWGSFNHMRAPNAASTISGLSFSCWTASESSKLLEPLIWNRLCWLTICDTLAQKRRSCTVNPSSHKPPVGGAPAEAQQMWQPRSTERLRPTAALARA